MHGKDDAKLKQPLRNVATGAALSALADRRARSDRKGLDAQSAAQAQRFRINREQIRPAIGRSG
jgi:hypothetical protein